MKRERKWTGNPVAERVSVSWAGGPVTERASVSSLTAVTASAPNGAAAHVSCYLSLDPCHLTAAVTAAAVP